jgi:hypothetical protein
MRARGVVEVAGDKRAEGCVDEVRNRRERRGLILLYKLRPS